MRFFKFVSFGLLIVVSGVMHAAMQPTDFKLPEYGPLASVQIVDGSVVFSLQLVGEFSSETFKDKRDNVVTQLIACNGIEKDDVFVCSRANAIAFIETYIEVHKAEKQNELPPTVEVVEVMDSIKAVNRKNNIGCLQEILAVLKLSS